MFITEQNGAEMWRGMLTENFNVTDTDKLNWVSQYAALHEIYESQIGVNANQYVPNQTQQVGPIYTTPLNTTGMGNVAAPENPNVNSTAPYAQGNLWNQAVGSGDIPVSTLPMALNIALLTIGLELVPVIPAKGPWHMLSYMDFPYAGGKLGRTNETVWDGKGPLADNKPIYVKAAGLSITTIKALREKGWKVGDEVTIDDFKGTFLCFGRMDGAPLFKVVECGDKSLREAFADATEIAGVTLKAVPEDGPVEGEEYDYLKADFVQTSVDLVDGFANFATGKKEAMTRAQNETGTGNTIGLRLFNKWVQVGAYEVTGTVTRQQLQDLPLYGVDAVGKVMEAMQNELTQHINQRILERVFALGVTNAQELTVSQGVDLNLYMGDGASVDFSEFPVAHYTNMQGVDLHETAGAWGDVKNADVLTSAENLHTRQRRILSRILAASNLIQNTGRRGRATWIVTNAKIATALQDIAGYVVAPMVNGMAQDGSKDLYFGGSVAGLKVYVDPYMDWEDCRICVGRKGDANSPGVVFMPYILADKVQIVAEGTMAPKMLLNSRFAIAEIGFYPEKMYYTFGVFSKFDIV